jgi:hypothetical protein
MALNKNKAALIIAFILAVFGIFGLLNWVYAASPRSASQNQLSEIIGTIVLIEGNYYEVRTPEAIIYKLKVNDKTIFSPNKEELQVGIRVRATFDENKNCSALSYYEGESYAQAETNTGKVGPGIKSAQEILGTLVSIEGDLYEIRTPAGKTYKIKVSNQTRFSPNKKFFVLGVRVRAVCDEKTKVCSALNYESGDSKKVPPKPNPNVTQQIIGTLVSIEGNLYEIRTPAGKTYKIKVSNQTRFSPNKKFFVLGVRVRAVCDANKDCSALNQYSGGSGTGPGIAPVPYAGAPLQCPGKLVALSASEIVINTEEGKSLKLKITPKTAFKPSKDEIKLNQKVLTYYDRNFNCLEIKPAPIVTAQPVSGALDVQGTLVSLDNEFLVLKTSKAGVLHLKITPKTAFKPSKKYFTPGKKVYLYYDKQDNCLEVKPPLGVLD